MGWGVRGWEGFVGEGLVSVWRWWWRGVLRGGAAENGAMPPARLLRELRWGGIVRKISQVRTPQSRQLLERREPAAWGWLGGAAHLDVADAVRPERGPGSAGMERREHICGVRSRVLVYHAATGVLLGEGRGVIDLRWAH